MNNNTDDTATMTEAITSIGVVILLNTEPDSVLVTLARNEPVGRFLLIADKNNKIITPIRVK